MQYSSAVSLQFGIAINAVRAIYFLLLNLYCVDYGSGLQLHCCETAVDAGQYPHLVSETRIRNACFM